VLVRQSTDRTSARRSMIVAWSGKYSEMRTPGTLVAVEPNGPRTSLGAETSIELFHNRRDVIRGRENPSDEGAGNRGVFPQYGSEARPPLTVGFSALMVSVHRLRGTTCPMASMPKVVQEPTYVPARSRTAWGTCAASSPAAASGAPFVMS
jgi:hypothetical protein